MRQWLQLRSYTVMYKWHQYKRYICLFVFIIWLEVPEEAFLLYVEKWQLKTEWPPRSVFNRLFMMINFALQGCNLRLKSTSSCAVIYGWPGGCAIITNGKKDNAIRFSSTPRSSVSVCLTVSCQRQGLCANLFSISCVELGGFKWNRKGDPN